jgi:hypothetical protein
VRQRKTIGLTPRGVSRTQRWKDSGSSKSETKAPFRSLLTPRSSRGTIATVPPSYLPAAHVVLTDRASYAIFGHKGARGRRHFVWIYSEADLRQALHLFWVDLLDKRTTLHPKLSSRCCGTNLCASHAPRSTRATGEESCDIFVQPRNRPGH